GAVLENLRADFVRTARAKGVAESDVLWHHVFRNSLLPLITVAAYILPGMLAGSLIVEVIFTLPGMGKLMIESIEFKDQEVVMSVTLISGILTLLSYLVADMLYAVADPRVSYD
ncbi:MAG: ABC transporter permease, partial [Phycisphaerae bacterium]|nr:ABC transporter permease [Phycisphaerae bacterium]